MTRHERVRGLGKWYRWVKNREKRELRIFSVLPTTDTTLQEPKFQLETAVVEKSLFSSTQLSGNERTPNNVGSAPPHKYYYAGTEIRTWNCSREKIIALVKLAVGMSFLPCSWKLTLIRSDLRFLLYRQVSVINVSSRTPPLIALTDVE